MYEQPSHPSQEKLQYFKYALSHASHPDTKALAYIGLAQNDHENSKEYLQRAIDCAVDPDVRAGAHLESAYQQFGHIAKHLDRAAQLATQDNTLALVEILRSERIGTENSAHLEKALTYKNATPNLLAYVHLRRFDYGIGTVATLKLARKLATDPILVAQATSQLARLGVNEHMAP